MSDGSCVSVATATTYDGSSSDLTDCMSSSSRSMTASEKKYLRRFQSHKEHCRTTTSNDRNSDKFELTITDADRRRLQLERTRKTFQDVKTVPRYVVHQLLKKNEGQQEEEEAHSQPTKTTVSLMYWKGGVAGEQQEQQQRKHQQQGHPNDVGAAGEEREEKPCRMSPLRRALLKRANICTSSGGNVDTTNTEVVTEERQPRPVLRTRSFDISMDGTSRSMDGTTRSMASMGGRSWSSIGGTKRNTRRGRKKDKNTNTTTTPRSSSCSRPTRSMFSRSQSSPNIIIDNAAGTTRTNSSRSRSTSASRTKLRRSRSRSGSIGRSRSRSASRTRLDISRSRSCRSLISNKSCRSFS